MKTLAFFNNKGGVGKTSLVYHLSYLYADLGLSVVAADLDPQANLTAMFMAEGELESLWPETGPSGTVLMPLLPFLEGEGGIGEPHVAEIDDIGLVAGDLALSGFEDDLSQQWPYCLEGKPRAFRVISAFHEVLQRAAQAREADLVLVDVGPNLGAINRSALIAADYVVIPLAPDLFSLKGLQNLGPRLREWRGGWEERLDKRPASLDLPVGRMEPAGYVVMQHAVRLDRPVKAYGKWMERIPITYREAVLGEDSTHVPPIENDPYCLATLKHYRSLMPLAQEARKPMFSLKPADGAIGGHSRAVQDCYHDFRKLALAIAKRVEVPIP
jgi:chromosome partitioning protein